MMKKVRSPMPEPTPDLAALVASLEERLRRATAHLEEVERIGRLGSYDWDIATDTNRWSDELFRIYGTEPQSFNPSYERFMEFVHPEDRDAVMAVHRQALADPAPYFMEERIIRPDGEVRILSTAGEIVVDDAGQPQRMIGVCMDVTDHRRAEEASAKAAERFQSLLDSSPDAVLVVDQDGFIVQVNGEVEAIFGYDAHEIVGTSVDNLLPERLRTAHRGHRAQFAQQPRRRAMGAGLDLRAVRKDGSEVPVDVSLGTIATDSGLVVTAFVRDVSERVRAEQIALQLHDAEERRRHALEINDSVIQGLSTVFYALEAGDELTASEAAAKTIATARLMMDDLLQDQRVAPLGPGDLVRATAASVLDHSLVPEPLSAPVPDGRSLGVLLVDDAADLRLLMRLSLQSSGGIVVVGEAGDGREGLDLASQLQPDVVLLDLAMPIMDGLEALPLIREAAPAAKVVVLSGFDDRRMRESAMRLGAVAYVEKGTPTAELVSMIKGFAPGVAAAEPPPATLPEDPFAARSGSGLDVDHLVHELRTPLTVIQGLAATLAQRGDALPSATAAELLQALHRNSKQMSSLLDAVASARDLDAGMTLYPEPIVVTDFVTEVMNDLSSLLDDRTVTIDTTSVPDGTTVALDPLRIRQVVTNLVTNAVRFSPPGAPIDVAAALVGDDLVVSCRDRGPGIAEERRAELFREHSRLGADGPGMGLGLFISRGIARAHGGDLRHEPAEGGGSRFLLTLPATASVPTD